MAVLPLRAFTAESFLSRRVGLCDDIFGVPIRSPRRPDRQRRDRHLGSRILDNPQAAAHRRLGTWVAGNSAHVLVDGRPDERRQLHGRYPDGIAAAQAKIRCGGRMSRDQVDGGSSTLARLRALIAASSIGFLLHNWHPARVFMGDVGSVFIGYGLSVLPFFVSQTRPWSASSLLARGRCFSNRLAFTLRLSRGANVFTWATSLSAFDRRRPRASRRCASAPYTGLTPVVLYSALAWARHVAMAGLAIAVVTALMCTAAGASCR